MLSGNPHDHIVPDFTLRGFNNAVVIWLLVCLFVLRVDLRGKDLPSQGKGEWWPGGKTLPELQWPFNLCCMLVLLCGLLNFCCCRMLAFIDWMSSIIVGSLCVVIYTQWPYSVLWLQYNVSCLSSAVGILLICFHWLVKLLQCSQLLLCWNYPCLKYVSSHSSILMDRFGKALFSV